MTLAAKLHNLKSSLSKKLYLEFLDYFNSLKRASVNFDQYQAVIDDLTSQIYNSPNEKYYKIELSPRLDESVTLVDMLVVDGFTNFKLSKNVNFSN